MLFGILLIYAKTCLRPYHVESTTSRPICQVKQRWAWLVLGSETAWESQVIECFGPEFSTAVVRSEILENSRRCGRFLHGTLYGKQYLQKPNYHLKVLGGTDVEVGEHPWTVAIYMKSNYCCVGTLISRKHVITAAHCFFRENVKPTIGRCKTNHAITEEEALKYTEIRYGSRCLKQSRTNNCFNSLEMKGIGIVRAQYGRFFRQKCFGGDIALLELAYEISEKDANYICLANRVLGEKFYTIQSTGWGNNPIMKRTIMNTLQKLEFHYLFDRDTCMKKMGGYNISNDVVCTEETHNRNVCLGDSGGGLMVQLHDGRWLLRGIVSYGTSCNKLVEKKAQPSAQVYTDIKMYGGEIDRFTKYFLPWEYI
ncbi:unnamed protein product [Cercopithifilaria johnstoni]|uniref:Peptidase S1 domain-containing protein n=1 Tax=Cercopithifilaria johnstoni TaxID=2874296 RepID=A0A8J2Q496_9BILA|nr:unnamed protein product [Cercopithifilaria johnstoni]